MTRFLTLVLSLTSTAVKIQEPSTIPKLVSANATQSATAGPNSKFGMATLPANVYAPSNSNVTRTNIGTVQPAAANANILSAVLILSNIRIPTLVSAPAKKWSVSILYNIKTLILAIVFAKKSIVLLVTTKTKRVVYV